MGDSLGLGFWFSPKKAAQGPLSPRSLSAANASTDSTRPGNAAFTERMIRYLGIPHQVAPVRFIVAVNVPDLGLDDLVGRVDLASKKRSSTRAVAVATPLEVFIFLFIR
jgi:hypothetical protein